MPIKDREIIRDIVLSKKARKFLGKTQPQITSVFQAWVQVVEEKGIEYAQKVPRFKDHQLIGRRKGERAIKLDRSTRVIYKIEASNLNKYFVHIKDIRGGHDYRKK